MRRWLRTLWGYGAFGVLLLVWLIVMVVLRLVTAPFDPTRRVVGRFFRWIAVTEVRLLPGVRVRIDNLHKRTPGVAYVVVANHESQLDILLLSHMPWEMKWMCKQSMFRLPIIGPLLRLAGDIPVQRGDHDSGKAALLKGADYLRQGMSVMVFPEGTRTRDGNLLPFKEGAFRLAIQTGCPVLPVAILGAAGGMSANTIFLDGCELRAAVLDPVDVAGLTEEDVPTLTARVRDQIKAVREAHNPSLVPGHDGSGGLAVVSCPRVVTADVG